MLLQQCFGSGLTGRPQRLHPEAGADVAEW
jgi:hypothetical protein